MRRSLLALFLGLASCTKPEKAAPDPPPVPLQTATAGLTTPLYQSGSRLKLRWAEPVAEPSSIRLPIAVFDTKLDHDCELEYGPGDVACIPVADVEPGFEDIVFLGSDETDPALLVDDDACGVRAEAHVDHRLWALPLHRGKTLNRYVLGEAHRVLRYWEAAGGGCTPTYEKRWQTRCVRPFRQADLHDVVVAKQVALGRAGDDSGVVVAVGTDGSVLPLHMDPEYLDAANDIRCAVEADACVPRWPDRLDTTPAVGEEMLVHTNTGRWSHWGQRYGEDVWAVLTPPASEKDLRPQRRTVLALLTSEQALHLAPLTVGQGRIVLRGKAMPDGRRVPLSFQDTRLQRDCVPAQIDDGTWRCTVQLPLSCQKTVVGPSDAATEAISPSSSFCTKPETCCQGGPIWFPRVPARGPRRFDVNPDPSSHPAVPGRAVRFAEAPRTTDHAAMWQPQHRVLVYDRIEDVGPEVFAALRIVQDP